MKTKVLFLIGLFVLPTSTVFPQYVVVTGKKVTYTRPKPLSEFKKTFTINYPKIKAATPALSRKIEDAVSYQKAFALNVEEEKRDIQWLEEADYDVQYNKNGLLNLILSINGTGAYPSGISKSVIADTKTGKRVLPGEIFVYINGLVAMAKKAQKKEISDAIKEIKADKEYQEPEPEKLFENADFTIENLKGFSISDEGVTFHYDYGFPHVILALQPIGAYFFTWAEMKPYIRAAGLLGRFVR